jgi:hypothetical protein
LHQQKKRLNEHMLMRWTCPVHSLSFPAILPKLTPSSAPVMMLKIIRLLNSNTTLMKEFHPHHTTNMLRICVGYFRCSPP